MKTVIVNESMFDRTERFAEEIHDEWAAAGGSGVAGAPHHAFSLGRQHGAT